MLRLVGDCAVKIDRSRGYVCTVRQTKRFPVRSKNVRWLPRVLLLNRAAVLLLLIGAKEEEAALGETTIVASVGELVG